MYLALVFPVSREKEARIVETRLARFTRIELFCLQDGETAASAMADVRDASQVLFLLDNSIAPSCKREAWAGLLEHLEGNHDPPAAFYFLEPVQVPAVVRRAACPDLRAVDRWAAAQLPLPGHTPALLPWFEGREYELSVLFEQLVDEPGVFAITGPPLCGKSSLAQQFTSLAAPYFQQVVWISDGRSIPSAAVVERSLIVVDDAPEGYGVPTGKSSVLLTARECLVYPELRLSAVPLPDPPSHPLFPRLALFHRHGFHRLATGLSLSSLQHLVELRCLDPVDAAGDWYRLPWLATPDETSRAQWAEDTHRCLLSPGERHAWLPETFPAFEWAVRHNWPLAAAIARRGAAAFEQSGHRPEAAALWQLLYQHARRQGDVALAAEAASAHAWIVNEHTGVYRTLNPGDQLSLFNSTDY